MRSGSRLIALLICSFFLTSVVLAQDEPITVDLGPPAHKKLDPKLAASLSGTVTRAGDQTPIRRAKVMLYPFDSASFMNRPDLDSFYTTETDSSGLFSIKNIRPGKYWLSIVKPGFFWVDESSKPVVKNRKAIGFENSQNQDKLTFTLSSAAVITGRISDNDGEAARFATVTALRMSRVGGKRKFTPVRAVEGNDLGEFRLYDLQPGRYFVTAQGANPMRAILTDQSEENMVMLAATIAPMMGERADGVQAQARVLTTYYPGTTASDEAASVTVQSGQESRADFNVQMVKPSKLKGRISGLPANYQPQLMVTRKGARQSREAMLFDGEIPLQPIVRENEFTVAGVPPGEYQLLLYAFDRSAYDPQARSGRKFMTGRLTVNVLPEIDVEGIEIQAQEHANIQGKVTVEGMKPLKKDQGFPVTLQLTSDSDEGGTSYLGIGPDGTFSLQEDGIPTATRWLTLRQGRGENSFYIKSARLGPLDVLEKGLPPDAGNELSIVVGNKASSVDVVAVRDKNAPAGGATAVVFPADALQHRHRYFKGTTDQNGKASFKGLAPGDYYVLAWEQDPDTVGRTLFDNNVPDNFDSVRDEEFMNPHRSKLVKLTVLEGQKYEASVQMIQHVEETEGGS